MAVAVDVAALGSPLGVASENSACLPAGRAWRVAGVGWPGATLAWWAVGPSSSSDSACWSIGIQ